MESFTLMLVLGNVCVVSFVKTNANCFRRIWVFSLFSFVSCHCFFNDTTLMLSCFIDLTHVQKKFCVVFIPSFSDGVVHRRVQGKGDGARPPFIGNIWLLI